MDPNTEIVVPFMLAEWPRIFLQWLALRSNLPTQTREKIADWLHYHNSHLSAYMTERYGESATVGANELSIKMGAVFQAEIEGEHKKAMDEMFERLEDEIFGGNGA